MAVQAETLFLHDRRGRLRAINEPPYSRAAPYVFVGRTPQGGVWRFRADLPEGLCVRLRELEPTQGGTDEGVASSFSEALRSTLEGHGYPVGREWCGPAYYFLTRPSASPGSTVVIGRENCGLLSTNFALVASDLKTHAPCVAVVRDGIAVAVCRTVRRSAAGVEAGVDTIPSHRNRGFGALATRRWAAIVWDAGLIPFYSTSSANLASRRLAERIGLVQFGSDLHLSPPSGHDALQM